MKTDQTWQATDNHAVPLDGVSTMKYNSQEIYKGQRGKEKRELFKRLGFVP